MVYCWEWGKYTILLDYICITCYGDVPQVCCVPILVSCVELNGIESPAFMSPRTSRGGRVAFCSCALSVSLSEKSESISSQIRWEIRAISQDCWTINFDACPSPFFFRFKMWHSSGRYICSDVCGCASTMPCPVIYQIIIYQLIYRRLAHKPHAHELPQNASLQPKSDLHQVLEIGFTLDKSIQSATNG